MNRTFYGGNVVPVLVHFFFTAAHFHALALKKVQTSFFKIIRNKQYYADVLPKRFLLNGNITEFPPNNENLSVK